MRRADRLFEIIQLLRRQKVLTARRIAEGLEVSERTIYRDIQDLIAAKVPIEGEAGVGYALRPGYDLPPLMFSVEELEALVLGARIVQKWTDAEMATSAERALAKIESVLPGHLQPMIRSDTLFAPPTGKREPLSFDLAKARAAVREQRKIRFSYRDVNGRGSDRTVRPLSLWFYGPVWVMSARCELREDFRFFRLDRMDEVSFSSETFEAEPGRSVEDLMRQLGPTRFE